MRAPLGRVFIFGSASDVAIGRKRASLVFWLRSGTVASTVSPGASSNTVERGTIKRCVKERGGVTFRL